MAGLSAIVEDPPRHYTKRIGLVCMPVIRRRIGQVLYRVHGVLGKILKDLDSAIKNKVVSLRPKGPIRGHVLLSYRIDLFLTKPVQSNRYYHYNRHLSMVMAETFVDLGFAVDVISNEDTTFLPRKNYALFIDTRMNFERLAPLINKECVKILHATTAHPYFNNCAEMKRLLNLQERRHVTLRSRRYMSPKFAMATDYADVVFVHCEFGRKNYEFAGKPIYLVPNAVPYRFPWMESKNYEACRRQFLWLGSGGMVHKGLDVLLEAFVEMPDYHLTVCGPVVGEKDFEQAYFKELYHTSNIHTYGWVDVESPEFMELTHRCLGMVYPSCSEMNAGSVLTCMHAGLIPIVSYESGVDMRDDIGVTLKTCSIQEIQEAVCSIAGLPAQELKERSRKAWEFARAIHTMENFKKIYRARVEEVLSKYEK